jgi:NADH-quinone oxidoreductase subunit N
LIDALVDGGYAWLSIVLVVGSMISLGYYLRVIATMWMGESVSVPAAAATAAPATGPGGHPVIAGGSQEADAEHVDGAQPEVLLVAWLATAAVLVFGIVPQPLFELAGKAGSSLTGIF